MIEIKLADQSNFHEDSMKDFIRFQTVKHIYILRDGELKLIGNPFTEDWDEARKREKALEILSGEYVTYCAFEGERVVGSILLIPELNRGRLIVDSFHVSGDCRRQGIGRMLFEAARAEAEKRGATGLYASCCSAEETIRFYLAMGFRPSPDPIREYQEDEPFDIQMECAL